MRLMRLLNLPVRVLAPALLLLALGAGVVAWTSSGTAPTAFPGIGGPFTLTAQTGRPVTEKALEGHPSLLFFGYTHCPDVCPTTLFQMSELMRALGPEPGVNAAFFTVDPERDTPPVIAEYLSSFDPHILGLTGDPATVEGVLKQFRVYAKKVPGKDGDYTMDHSALVYLMDKAGRFVGAFNLDRPPADGVAQLRKMM